MPEGLLYVVAVEPSGDLLARETLDVLADLDPQLRFAGVGGDELQKHGIVSPIDVSELALVGFFDGLKIYPKVLRLVCETVADIMEKQPDAVVLVDSWGFTSRVGKALRKAAPGLKQIKLLGPQVWATRPGRARRTAATFDHLIAMHDIEVPFYEPYNLPVTVIGNPALDRSKPGDAAACRKALGLDDSTPIVLVLPGSRGSELRRVAPDMVDAARLIKKARNDIAIVFAPAPPIREGVEALIADGPSWAHMLPEHVSAYDAMAAADLALACSGTVTSELAVQGTPFIVAYRTGPLTYFLGKNFLFKPRHVTLLNIAADDQTIVPEILQKDLTPEALSAQALDWLADPQSLVEQSARQTNALKRMRREGPRAVEVAADAILSVLQTSKP